MGGWVSEQVSAVFILGYHIWEGIKNFGGDDWW